ncbi:MAG: hypothetical protein Q8R69_17205 [Telluria sp.]|nr:hypothetical protein [Telluria sp.]
MLFTVLSRAVAVALLAAASCAALAEDAPRTLQDPVLGLRYQIATVQFDALPGEVLSTCPVLVNEQWDRRLWVYASLRDSERTYYVVGGYYIRRFRSGDFRQFEPDPKGVVFQVEGTQCTLIGPAREVFDAQPEEIALPVLEQLATDLFARYMRAFGGPDQFRAELRRQHVEPKRLSTVLREAFYRPGPEPRLH